MQTITHEGYELAIDSNDTMGDTLLSTGEWEPVVNKWINNCVEKGDVAIDIGAKFGIHTFAFRKNVGDDGEVHAFEPNPQFRTILEENVDRNHINNIFVYEYALSNEHTTAEYSVINSRCSNSSYIGEADEMYTVEEIPLSSTLDNYDVVKMDVEGSEEKIIPELDLSSMKHLIVEIHDDVLSETTINNLTTLLEEQGSIKWNNHRFLWSAD